MIRKTLVTNIAKNITPICDINELYMIIASVVIYFIDPLVNESWNTFPSRFKDNISESIYLTDEEKNPHHKLSKKEKDMIFNLLIDTKNKLRELYPNITKLSKYGDKDKDKVKDKYKELSNNEMNKLVKLKLDELEKIVKYCKICRDKIDIKNHYKSIYNDNSVFFCSLKCMEKWNY